MIAVRRAGAALVVTGALLAGVVVHASAAEPSEQRRDDIESEVSDLEESIDEVAAEEEAVQADLEETRRSVVELDARLRRLDDDLAAERRALLAARDAREQAIARQIWSRDRLTAVKRDLSDSTTVMTEQAVTTFMRFGTTTDGLDPLLDASNVHELHGARVFADVVAGLQRRKVEQHRKIREEHVGLEAEAEEARLVADERTLEVESRTAAVERLRAELAEVRTEVTQRQADEERLLAGVQVRKTEYEQRVASLRQESDAIAEQLRATQVDQIPTPSGTGKLGSPLVNARMTSAFGYRIHPIFGTRRLHAGIDFGAAQGTPILASADGRVTSAGWQGGYGNTVVIDHGGAIATLYAHQSRLGVTAGSTVVRGQVIGYVGSTGNSTGPHLHFEVRVNGTPVDPRNYL